MKRREASAASYILAKHVSASFQWDRREPQRGKLARRGKKQQRLCEGTVGLFMTTYKTHSGAFQKCLRRTSQRLGTSTSQVEAKPSNAAVIFKAHRSGDKRCVAFCDSPRSRF